MFDMINYLQASIEHKWKIEECLENEKPFNIGIDIEEETTDIFQNLLNETRSELYPNCSQYSSLKIFVKMMYVNVLNGWSNKSFDMMLDLIKNVFPMYRTNVLSSFYEAK